MRAMLLAGIALALPASAEATIKSYAFTGVVETSLYDGRISVGDQLTGTVSYNNAVTAPSSVQTSPERDVARYDALTFLQFVFPNITLTYSGNFNAIGEKGFDVVEAKTAGVDGFAAEVNVFTSYPGPPTIEVSPNTLSVFSMFVRFDANGNGAIGSTELLEFLPVGVLTGGRFEVNGFPTGGRITSIRALQNDVPGIPEPASWATMIAGFALAGAAARRRRPAPQAA